MPTRTARWTLLWLLAAAPALPACARPAPAVAAAAASAAYTASGFTGDIRRHPDVPSRYLSRTRDVWVYLPPGYDRAGATRYPVLYLHDGNNVFDGKTAFGGHEWQADETAERLIRSGALPPLILVAVGNTPERTREYTWVSGLVGGHPEGGRGQDYARFLVEELKPLIDRTYRTRPGPADTGVLGSSLGGLESLYLGRYHAATFGKIGVMSPSVWWADRAVLKEAERYPTGLKVWLDMGAKEGDTPDEELENTRALKARLVARGYAEGRDLSYYEDAEGGHNELAWAYRLPLALAFLFGPGEAR